jgi:hypothetical protein
MDKISKFYTMNKVIKRRDYFKAEKMRGKK